MKKLLYFIFIASGMIFIGSGLALFTDIFDGENKGFVYYYPSTQKVEVSTNPVKDIYGAMTDRMVEINYKYHAISGCNPSTIPVPTPTPTPNPAPQKHDWGFDKIRAGEAHKEATGRGVKVAVLDTGVQSGHPDLPIPVFKRNYTGGNSLDVEDRAGHGTHVSGIILARDNQVGVVGVCPNCQLLVYKVLGDDGSGNLNQIAQAIIDAANFGADVINMSLGGPSQSSILDSSIQFAKSKGVQVVVARGNNGTTQPLYPGSSTGVISVSATNINDSKATFSSYGWSLGVTPYSAPGASILSTCIGSKYCTMSGTSMASPYVAGVCALAIGQGKSNCDDLGTVKDQNFYKYDTHGKGRVDALLSL